MRRSCRDVGSVGCAAPKEQVTEDVLRLAPQPPRRRVDVLEQLRRARHRRSRGVKRVLVRQRVHPQHQLSLVQPANNRDAALERRRSRDVVGGGTAVNLLGSTIRRLHRPARPAEVRHRRPRLDHPLDRPEPIREFRRGETDFLRGPRRLRRRRRRRRRVRGDRSGNRRRRPRAATVRRPGPGEAAGGPDGALARSPVASQPVLGLLGFGQHALLRLVARVTRASQLGGRLGRHGAVVRFG